MKAIHIKLLRDLRRLRGQVLTIGLMGASGIASFVALQTTWLSLESSKNIYYQQQAFAHIFAQLERAPHHVRRQLEEIPGVFHAESRITDAIRVPVKSLPEPAIGRIISLPAGSWPVHNQPHLRAGRRPQDDEPNEIILLESFAEAHHIQLGETVPAVISGTLRNLRVVGTALSPEFVFSVAAGDFTADDELFAVFWMNESAVAAATGMEGSFNDVTFTLMAGASATRIIAEIDRILEPYGGIGAIEREHQPSHQVLDGELQQLRQFAVGVPLIFLAVAAFLLNVVLSRLIFLQRQQIATLKAVGYSQGELAFHFLALISIILLIGSLIGSAAGLYLGRALTGLYGGFFHFPELMFSPRAWIFVTAIALGLLPGVVGGLANVLRIARMPAAQAMQPPSPARYKKSLLDRLPTTRLLGSSGLMILRELRRHPVRLTLSSVGIAAAIGVVILGRFGQDSFRYLLDNILLSAQRGDITVTFIEPMPAEVVYALAREPGVVQIEGFRAVPVRLLANGRSRDTAITGLSRPPDLRRVVSRDGETIALPLEGIALSRKLAEVLGVSVGDTIVAQVREGNWQTIHLSVLLLVDDAFGLQAYAYRDFIDAQLGHVPTISAVEIRMDPWQASQLYDRLQDMPNVLRIERRDSLMERFEEQTGETMQILTLVLVLFAVTISVGVVYNNARIALSLRSRDLSSLRVLGFTRAEISAILLGELAAQIILAIPVGLLLGHFFAQAVLGTVDSELYRLPLVISPTSYSLGVSVAVLAGLASALWVRRRLDRMDLIGVLKTRE